MGEKEAASQALEGTFDTNALRAMMNGGKDDDIIAALANRLEAGQKVDARAAWRVEPKPVRKPKLPKPKVIEMPVLPRAWEDDFLFDMSPARETACALA